MSLVLRHVLFVEIRWPVEKTWCNTPFNHDWVTGMDRWPVVSGSNERERWMPQENLTTDKGELLCPGSVPPPTTDCWSSPMECPLGQRGDSIDVDGFPWEIKLVIAVKVNTKWMWRIELES